MEPLNKFIAFDSQGFLKDQEDWTEMLARAIAEKEGITLTPEHWEIIFYLRAYYQEYATTPAIRLLVKLIKKKFGFEKGNSLYLHMLFPKGPAKQACKIAGLPKPVHCI